jgi:hypothetical protein
LQIFLARLVQSLPLRRPSPVDSPGLRRLIATRSSGLTWTICKAFERAAVAAIASGEERLDRSSLEGQAVWRGLTTALGAAEGAGEAQQDQRPVALTPEIAAADGGQLDR